MLLVQLLYLLQLISVIQFNITMIPKLIYVLNSDFLLVTQRMFSVGTFLTTTHIWNLCFFTLFRCSAKNLK